VRKADQPAEPWIGPALISIPECLQNYRDLQRRCSNGDGTSWDQRLGARFGVATRAIYNHHGPCLHVSNVREPRPTNLLGDYGAFPISVNNWKRSARLIDWITLVGEDNDPQLLLRNKGDICPKTACRTRFINPNVVARSFWRRARSAAIPPFVRNESPSKEQ
jgi:hypothetical protein